MIRWIASYPKSGNSWVRLFLRAYEVGKDFKLSYGSVNVRSDADDKAWEEISPVALNELQPDEMVAMRGALLVRMIHLAPEKTVWVKTHVACGLVNNMPMIPQALTAAVVYILRDPRDIAISYADHAGVDIDTIIEDMGSPCMAGTTPNGILEPITDWSTHVRSWRNSPFPTHYIRYEDLQENAGRTFRNLFSFFGATFHQDRFEQALEITKFENLQRLEAAGGYEGKAKVQSKFFRSGRVGAWREELTRDQIARIEKVHGEMMTECGYERAT